MKKIFLTFLISLFSFVGFSQNIEDIILRDSEFKILSEKSIKYYSSDKYINYKKLSREFRSKLPVNYYTEESSKFNEFEDWIKKNILLTKFNSVEEALELHKQNLDGFINNKKDEKEIINLLFKLSDKYGRDNFKPVFDKYIFSKFYEVWK